MLPTQIRPAGKNNSSRDDSSRQKQFCPRVSSSVSRNDSNSLYDHYMPHGRLGYIGALVRPSNDGLPSRLLTYQNSWLRGDPYGSVLVLRWLRIIRVTLRNQSCEIEAQNFSSLLAPRPLISTQCLRGGTYWLTTKVLRELNLRESWSHRGWQRKLDPGCKHDLLSGWEMCS